MKPFVDQSRDVAKSIDAGRKTGNANIEGTTAAEIQASLIKSLGEFAATAPTPKSQSNVKGIRVVTHNKVHFGG